MIHQSEDTQSDDTDESDQFIPSPELQAAFDATDRLVEGLTGEERLRFAREMYADASGMPQWRRARIRSVVLQQD